MKIGIITFHYSDNYGAMLQAYAMQAALKEMGHDPYFVYLRDESDFISKYEGSQGKSLKQRCLAIIFRLLRKPLRIRHKRFEDFFSAELPVTRRYANEKELVNDPPDVDAYVCGSDQIWNLESGIMHFFYGKFVPEGVKLISYAPSFGNTNIPKIYSKEILALLNRFDHLAVREESGCKMLCDLTGRSITRTIDPVFLIDSKIWCQLSIAPIIKIPFIAYYSLEMTAHSSAIVARISRITKMPVVVIAKGGLFMLNCRTIVAIDAGPREFLGWIKHAKMVLTNSFHGTVFAIKFDVPFVTIAHSHRNTRMENLLKIAGLSDRLVHNVSELDHWSRERLLTSIGEIAKEKLAAEIEDSKNYLLSALVTPELGANSSANVAAAT